MTDSEATPGLQPATTDTADGAPATPGAGDTPADDPHATNPQEGLPSAPASPGHSTTGAVAANEPDPERWTSITETVAASIAFVIGLLLQIGISGIALQRLIRNEPAWFAVAVAITLLATIVFLASQLSTFFRRKAGRDRFTAATRWSAVVILAVSVVVTLVLGGTVLNLRDQPTSELRVDVRDDTTMLSVAASADALLAEEKMLVVVRAVWDVPPGVRPADICSSPSSGSTRWATVLYWSESPSDGAGSTSDATELKVSFDRAPKYYCSSALLISRQKEKRPRTAVTILRSDVLVSTPTPSVSVSPGVPDADDES